MIFQPAMFDFQRLYPRIFFGSAFSLYFVYVVFLSWFSARRSRWLFLGMCFGFPVDIPVWGKFNMFQQV